MSKIVRVIAIVTAMCAVSPSAYAGSFAPTEIKSFFASDGPATPDPTPFSSDDGNYISLSSVDTAPGPDRAGYVVLFEGLSKGVTDATVSFVGHSENHGCTMGIRMFKWSRRRWVALGQSLNVPEGPADGNINLGIGPLRPFVKNGKLKAEVYCVSFSGLFNFNTDHLAILA